MKVVLAGNNTAAIHTLDLLLEAGPPEDVLGLAPAHAHASGSVRREP